MICPDTDSLITIGAAIEWRIDEFLDHLRDCSDCRENLRNLSVVQVALSEVSQPHPATLSRAMADVTTADARIERFWKTISLSLTPLFAGFTAFFTLASGRTSFGAAVLGGALVAVGTLWWAVWRKEVGRSGSREVGSSG
jgi:predicted anti-sigma-YlaC factor YlaD